MNGNQENQEFQEYQDLPFELQVEIIKELDTYGLYNFYIAANPSRIGSYILTEIRNGHLLHAKRDDPKRSEKIDILREHDPYLTEEVMEQKLDMLEKLDMLQYAAHGDRQLLYDAVIKLIDWKLIIPDDVLVYAASQNFYELLVLAWKRTPIHDFEATNRAFYYGALNNNFEIVSFLNAYGSPDVYTGLRGAARGNNIEMIEFLYPDKNLNIGSVLMGSVLKEAAAVGNIDVFARFYSPFDIHSEDVIISAQEAGFNGQKEMIEYLINNVYTILADYGFVGAIMGNNLELTDYLFNKYINKSMYSWTTINRGLFYAAQNGDIDMIQYLINKYPLDYNRGLNGAAAGNHVDIMQSFIDFGANDLQLALDTAQGMKISRLKIF